MEIVHTGCHPCIIQTVKEVTLGEVDLGFEGPCLE